MINKANLQEKLDELAGMKVETPERKELYDAIFQFIIDLVDSPIHSYLGTIF